MKFKFLILGVLTFVVQSVYSQNYHLGLRTGFSTASLDTENDGGPEISNRDAFQIGLVHTYVPRNGPIGFSIETGYLLKGARVADTELDYRMHFLSMPTLLDIYPTKKFKISVGPSFNYLLDARNHINDSTSVTLSNIYSSRWEVSGVISASYALDYFADIGIRYTQGFNTLANRDAVLSRRRIRTSTFQIFLYFKIAN